MIVLGRSCPFCKCDGPHIQVHRSKGLFSGWACVCPNCGAQGPVKNGKRAAIEAWALAIRDNDVRVKNDVEEKAGW